MFGLNFWQQTMIMLDKFISGLDFGWLLIGVKRAVLWRQIS